MSLGPPTKLYRKKPVEVYACQAQEDCLIETLEGVMQAKRGDFIVTGIKGERYPVKPDIFVETYEEIT